MKLFLACCGVCWALAGIGRGQDLLDRLDEALTVSVWHDQARVHLSGLADLESYVFEHPAPGLIDTTQHFLFNPRITLFLDAQIGPAVYVFAQARLDRGFDPGDHGLRVQLDEYALRFTPWKDGRLNLQFGKASTVFGTWSGRHLSWENPFVNGPLPYENVTGVSDTEPPRSARGLNKVSADEKYEALPIVWGPAYTTGGMISGRVDRFEFAGEIKNAALSSRPESWDATEIGFDHPAFAARLSFHPDFPWTVGVSASDGAYLRPEAGSELSAGRGIGDYRQIVFGQDVSYASGHWQIWAECFESRFELPRVGHLDVFSYYLEVKYKFMPQFFGALRWNQQVFSATRGEDGSRDTARVDVALSYRFTPRLQMKVQGSFQDGNAPFGQGSTVATQLTLRF